MGELGWTKIFGSLLAAVLLVFGLRELSAGLFSGGGGHGAPAGHATEAGEGEAGHPAYAYYIPESSAEGAQKVEVVFDLGTALAAGDPSKGERTMTAKCASCHGWDEGGANKTGPNLYGVVDRAKASHEGFKYSTAMSGFGGNWTYEDLNGFLTNPGGYMKGTAMNFAGLRKDSERADVIAYLASITPGAPPFPAPASAGAPVETPAPAPVPETGAAVVEPAAFSVDLDGVTLTGNAGGVEERLIDFIRSEREPCTETACWFSMDRLTFNTGSASLDMEKSADQLRNIFEIMKAYPTIQLKVGGYTDNTGSEEANMVLSQARAEAVVSALVAMGLPAERFNAEGYGPAHPIATNDTEEGRAANRRIDVRVRQR